MIRLHVLIWFFLLTFVFGNENAPEVEIKQGILGGKYQKTFKGRTFSAFTGIPYAKPPVGDLRFKPPVPAEPWEGVLDATQSHPLCVQINIFIKDYSPKGQEDCLYLNVYTPRTASYEKELLPVIFYVHGGAYVNGKADWYEPDLLLDKDIVLVTTNYRLSALGFITTGDEVVPGNNGLKDQSLALKWTKNNIQHFGGDPNKITISGQSAGGASAHYHTISPLSRELISGAIINSGTAFSPWALSTNDQGIRNTKKLADLLKCPTSSSKEMIECLRSIDANQIVEQDVKFMEWSYDPMIPFKPTIEPNLEGAFLIEDPIDTIKSGKAANVPIITGVTSEDGAMKSASIYSSDLVTDLDKNFNKLAPLALQYNETVDDKDYVSNKIREFYFGNKAIDDSTKYKLTDVNAWFYVGENTVARLHFKYYSQPVYHFLFSYRGSASFTGVFGQTDEDYGVCHCDELLYLFNFKMFFPDYKPTESDQKMVDVMTTFWANFAKTGNPNSGEAVGSKTEWKPVSSNKVEYLDINNYNNVIMKDKLHQERIYFWRNLPINTYIKKIKDEL